MSEQKLRIGWCVPTLAPEVASVRYRALMPMYALQHAGHECMVFTPAHAPDLTAMDVIVFVKNFQPECLVLAAAARRAGVLVALDLCDNIFVPGYGQRGRIRPADHFRAMTRLADVVVATTQCLAAAIRDACPEAGLLTIVPDGIETVASRSHGETVVDSAARRAGGAEGLARRIRRYFARPDCLHPRAFLDAVHATIRLLADRWKPAHGGKSSSVPDAPRRVPATAQERRVLLWFGNHGAKHASFGMLDLLPLRAELEAIAAQWPVELVVISNSKDKFDRHIADFGLPTRYVEWTPEAVDEWLERADVVLVPNSLDAFSRCKSANRTVLALSRGVPVVATWMPALAPLKDVILTGGFGQGISRYLAEPGLANEHVRTAGPILQAEYGAGAIAAAWQDSLLQASKRAAPDPTAVADLVVAVNLMQDIDLAEPIIRAARACGWRVVVWASLSLIKKSPRAVSRLNSVDAPLVVLADNEPCALDFPDGIKALLCITETSLRPHRFTRLLVERAASAGVTTATVQHGIENVGLTYGDAMQPVSQVDIASQRIYLWGSIETLDADVNAATRERCIPTGCPKPALPAGALSLPPLPPAERIIGVFENLHWHRYDDTYREEFLAALSASAERFPSVVFLIKPHHAGMWLTSRFKGVLPQGENIVIADPSDPVWEPLTATDILPALSAVVSTPSTVVLDAARAGLPVATVAGMLDLPRYEPLPMLRTVGDWLSFIEASGDETRTATLVSRGKRFIERTVVEGDAAMRIVHDLLGHGRPGSSR